MAHDEAGIGQRASRHDSVIGLRAASPLLIELPAPEQLLQVVSLPDLPVGEVRQ